MIIILTLISIAVSVYLVRQYLRHEMGCDCHPHDGIEIDNRRLWR